MRSLQVLCCCKGLSVQCCHISLFVLFFSYTFGHILSLFSSQFYVSHWLFHISIFIFPSKLSHSHKVWLQTWQLINYNVKCFEQLFFDVSWAKKSMNIILFNEKKFRKLFFIWKLVWNARPKFVKLHIYIILNNSKFNAQSTNVEIENLKL